MTEIVDGIVAEETNLMMTGDDLPAVKRSFQNLAKDLLISVNLKTLNLQDLFVLQWILPVRLTTPMALH